MNNIANAAQGALASVQTETQGPPTTTTIPEPDTQLWATWAKFEPSGDPQRIKLVNYVGTFLMSARVDWPAQEAEERRQQASVIDPNIVKTIGQPYWLTLMGKTNTGKTHMANAILGWWNRCNRQCRKVYWPDIVEDLRKQDRLDCNDLKKPELLVIDEIGGETSQSDYSTGQLAKLLEARQGKWTVITTNQMLADIELIDRRIAGRIIRQPNRWLQMTCGDYFLSKRA